MIFFAQLFRLTSYVTRIQPHGHVFADILIQKGDTKVKEIIFAFLFAIQLLIVNIVAQAQPFQIINTQNSVVGGDLNKTVTTIARY